MQSDQIDNPQNAEVLSPVDTGRTSKGTFGKGNLIHEQSSRGRGFAKISARVEAILEYKTVADINHSVSGGNLENMKGVDAVAHRRARAAIYGLGQEAADVVDRIDGPVIKKIEHGGDGGGPIVMVSADVTQLLIEASNKAIADK